MSKVSNWWYLLPILFAVVGGVIGYFAVRHRDNGKAWNLLIVGLLLTVAQIILNVGWLLAISYMVPNWHL